MKNRITNPLHLLSDIANVAQTPTNINSPIYIFSISNKAQIGQKFNQKLPKNTELLLIARI
jgi:hypothetical protein